MTIKKQILFVLIAATSLTIHAGGDAGDFKSNGLSASPRSPTLLQSPLSSSSSIPSSSSADSLQAPLVDGRSWFKRTFGIGAPILIPRTPGKLDSLVKTATELNHATSNVASLVPTIALTTAAADRVTTTATQVAPQLVDVGNKVHHATENLKKATENANTFASIVGSGFKRVTSPRLLIRGVGFAAALYGISDIHKGVKIMNAAPKGCNLKEKKEDAAEKKERGWRYIKSGGAELAAGMIIMLITAWFGKSSAPAAPIVYSPPPAEMPTQSPPKYTSDMDPPIKKLS